MLDTPALARAEGFDVLDGDDDPTDPLTRHWWRLIQNPGHGTATASVIVAPGQDMFGAAPGATLIPIRCITGVVQVLDGDVALAIEAARRLRVDVITMSIGGEGFFPVLADALAAAVADGIVVLAAGGNYAPFVPAPARLRDCLAVAATGEDGRPWEFSSPGPEIDWAAPGSGLLVARAKLESGRPVYRVAPGAGSSFAVAHTAAVAALWVTHHGRDALRAKYPGAVQWAFREVATASVQPGTGGAPVTATARASSTPRRCCGVRCRTIPRRRGRCVPPPRPSHRCSRSSRPGSRRSGWPSCSASAGPGWTSSCAPTRASSSIT